MPPPQPPQPPQPLISAIQPSTSLPAPPQGQQQRTSGYGVSPNVITVNRRQEGNPLLRSIKNVRWQYDPAPNGPDYQLGEKTCAIFVSVRYHLLHPDYVLRRIKEQQPGRVWGQIILMCHVDCDDAVTPLAEIGRAAINSGCTLVCAWCPEECARYLETFKSYESKPAHQIQERVDQDHASRLHAALSNVRGVNKNDSQALYATRGTVADIFRSTTEQLSAIPGIGPTKVKRLIEAFSEPFRREVSSKTFASVARPSLKEGQQQQIRLETNGSPAAGAQDQEMVVIDDDDDEIIQATQILAAGCEQEEIDMVDDEDIGS